MINFSSTFTTRKLAKGKLRFFAATFADETMRTNKEKIISLYLKLDLIVIQTFIIKQFISSQNVVIINLIITNNG